MMTCQQKEVNSLHKADNLAHSSKDFGRVRSCLTADMPKKLIHKNVRERGADSSFSAERRHAVHVIDLPSTALSMTIGELHPWQSSRKHRHTYETIIYVLKGHGYSIINGERVDWKAGDAIYVPQWAWHQHFNESEDNCEYLGCENAPMLQRLGVALREESDD